MFNMIKSILYHPFWQKTYFGSTLGDFTLFFIVLLLSALLGKIVYYLAKTRVRKLTAKTKSNVDDILVDLVEEPLVFFIVILGFYFALKFLTLTSGLDNAVNVFLRMLIIIDVAWLLIRIIDSFLIYYITPLVEKSASDLDDQILPILKRLLKIALVSLAAIMIISDMGYDVGAIIAGLGIGGLAFALAAKDLLANMFGGIAIFIDKPFMIGDRIKFGNFDGKVKAVGLRTTRVTTFDGTELIVPNSHITNMEVENVTREPHRRIKIMLGVEYDTSNAKLKKAKTLLQSIIKKQKGVGKDFRVKFMEFADSSLNIQVIYYITDKKKIFDIQDEVNFAIKQSFEKEKISFAFPSQTIYMKK